MIVLRTVDPDWSPPPFVQGKSHRTAVDDERFIKNIKEALTFDHMTLPNADPEDNRTEQQINIAAFTHILMEDIKHEFAQSVLVTAAEAGSIMEYLMRCPILRRPLRPEELYKVVDAVIKNKPISGEEDRMFRCDVKNAYKRMEGWTHIFAESSESESEQDDPSKAGGATEEAADAAAGPGQQRDVKAAVEEVTEVITYAVSTQDIKPDDPINFEDLEDPWSDKRESYAAAAVEYF